VGGVGVELEDGSAEQGTPQSRRREGEELVGDLSMVETKVCTKCRETLPVSEFYRTRTRVRRYCKPCRKVALKARRVARAERLKAWQAARQEKIWALKKTLTCVDCGWGPTTDRECRRLHFDHIDPDTKWSAGGPSATGAFGSGWSWDHVLEEIALCVPRCSSCHAYRTNRQRRGLDPYPVPFSRADPSLPYPPTQGVPAPEVSNHA
jgi:hypothetical protein